MCILIERKLLDTIYVTDENLEPEPKENQAEEKKKEIEKSSGFYNFMNLLQKTVSFVSNSRRSSLVAAGGEESLGLSTGNIGYFWLYVKTLFYCKRWRAKIGQKAKHGIAKLDPHTNLN